MSTIRRIPTSQIDGNDADTNNENEIRPYGEIGLYEGNNNKLELLISDGQRTHFNSKVLAKGTFYGGDADSADGNNYDTIKLIPDVGLVQDIGTDQYVIIDPTAPDHVHIRAGGTIDNSSAELILGGENSYVKIGAGANPEITIESNNNSWTFDTDGTLIVPGVVQNTGSFEIKAGTATNSVEFLGQIDNGFGDGPGATLHVTSIINGTITDGMTIYGEGLPAEGWVLQFGTVMAPQGNGGTGNYYLSGANYLIGSQSFNNGDAASNIWTFAPSGDLIFPSQLSISPLSNFVPASGTAIQQASGQILDILSVGSGGFMAAGWVENSSSPGSVTSISFNEVPGDVRIKTGSFAEVVREWVYDSTGDLTIPGNINLSNSSKIATGTFDNGTSGNSGISLVCAVGYELNWQGGHLKNTFNNGVSSASILCDSAIEFPGSGVDNMEINSTGLIFSDGTMQNTAYNPKLFGSFYDTTTQNNISSSGVNTVSYNSTSISSGISITSGDKITFSKDGHYNIQFSLQYEKTDSGDDEINLWLSRTGTYEPWSNTSISVLGNDGKAVASWNFIVQANSGDYYQLHWHSPDTTMKLLAQTGLANPTRPDIPSVILTAIEI